MKEIGCKKFWRTRCARLVWQGLMVDIHSVFQKIKFSGLLYVIMSTSGGKKPQNPRKSHNPSPHSPHPLKITQQPKPYKTKMEPVLRTKRILMSYGLSEDMGYLIPAESKAKAKSSWLIKLVIRCRSGMHYLVLTCIPWNHIFITFDFWGASVTVWSSETKLVFNFCHELNQCLVFLQAFSLI